MAERILRTETGSQILRVKAVPPHVNPNAPHHAGGFQLTPLIGTVKAGGTVFVPASEIEMGKFYTFECEDGGRLFRWTEQQARVLTQENYVVFDLPAIDPQPIVEA